MFDAHLHLSTQALIQEMKTYQIGGIVNASSPQEVKQFLEVQRQWYELNLSVGIHPWQVEEIAWDVLYPYMEQATIIGEIGLDNVWCNTPLSLQKEVFEQSLAYAKDHHKPVILHIKGMEEEALAYLKKYPNTYLVHWYSCMEYLKEYMKLGCYFTIGPSVGKDEAVSQVARTVAQDHLLIETDGLNALSWCENREVKESEYVGMLKRSIERIAELRHIKESELSRSLDENIQRFLKIATHDHQ